MSPVGVLLTDGTATYALSKLVKRNVQRPRPAMLLAGARGRPPAGLGYLSGHAGVATALGAATLPRLSTAGRAAALGIVSASPCPASTSAPTCPSTSRAASRSASPSTPLSR